MNRELTAQVHIIGEIQQVTDTFKKRDLIVTFMDGDYEQFVKIEFTQDRTEKLDSIAVGDNVQVHYNLNGRKWEKDGKVNFFNTLRGWKVEKVANDQPETVAPDDDDLPF